MKTNRKRRCFILLTVLLLMTLVAFKSLAGTISSSDFKITAIQGFLYYHEQGKFDDLDVFSGIALRNVFIGEGDAESPSGAMLLVIRLQHSAFTVKDTKDMNLKVTVKANKRTLLNQNIRLDQFFSEKSQIEVPFIVYGIACEQIVASAMVTVQTKEVSSLNRSAKFRCGE